MKYDIKDIKLSNKGKQIIEWTGRNMPVLEKIKSDFKKNKPLKNVKVACCLHVTAETANLMLALKSGGAEVKLCASNPLSTQDHIAASLVKNYSIPVFAIRGENKDTYYRHIKNVLQNKPHITMDDGADLVSLIHKKHKSNPGVWGGTEETTTGVIRLRSLEKESKLMYPVIAVNDAYTKHLFDNRFGTGQSTIDGIIRATDMLIAGKKIVVCGYGWCGKGTALRAKGLGANVIVAETDPIRALEALMDGFSVMSLKEACKCADIFITLTGNTSVIRKEHFLLMKDSAIVANAGHFNVEIDIKNLKKLSKTCKKISDFIQEYNVRGKRIYLLGEGRLINLVASTGHPADVMDMSFANQALCCKYIADCKTKMDIKVYKVPEKIDKNIASMKLKSMGVKIDKLTKEQQKYLSSWQLGT